MLHLASRWHFEHLNSILLEILWCISCWFLFLRFSLTVISAFLARLLGCILSWRLRNLATLSSYWCLCGSSLLLQQIWFTWLALFDTFQLLFGQGQELSQAFLVKFVGRCFIICLLFEIAGFSHFIFLCWRVFIVALDAQSIEILNLNIWAVLGVLVHDGAQLAVLDGFADLCRRSLRWSLKSSSLLELWVKSILLKTTALFFLHFWLVILWICYFCFATLEPKKVLSVQIRHHLRSSRIINGSTCWRLQEHHGIRRLIHLLRPRLCISSSSLLNSWFPSIFILTIRSWHLLCFILFLHLALDLRLQTRWLNGTHTNMV